MNDLKNVKQVLRRPMTLLVTLYCLTIGVTYDRADFTFESLRNHVQKYYVFSTVRTWIIPTHLACLRHWVRREIRLVSDNSWALHRLKHLSWRSQWIILCTLERRMAVSFEISWADRCLFGLSWLSTRSSTATRRTRSYRCLVAGQLYPCCGFSSADCRCFQVSNPCCAIHWTVFVHHTALTDKDF